MATFFQAASVPIGPISIPQRRLYAGATMSAIDQGTFGSDHVSASQVAEVVHGAAAIGYPHFDCASSIYGDEAAVGESLAEILAGGVAREEICVTSPLWNVGHAERDVIPWCRRLLANLGLNYLDLYLIHWPFPNFHPPGCDAASRSADAKPYFHANFMRTWRKMEELVDLDLVSHIGTSNMTIPNLQIVLRDARIKPAVNEMELDPHFQQPELLRYVVENGIQPIDFSSIGSPRRPERYPTSEDSSPTEDPVIAKIAEKHGIHPAVVSIKSVVQRAQIPIPFSVNAPNYLANLCGVASDPLSSEEMEEIAAIDRNCRWIKGEVFLWREGQSCQNLWDADGEIAPL